MIKKNFARSETIGEQSIVQLKADEKQYILKKVFLKRKTTEELALARREFNVMNEIMHPNIVTYYDYWEEDHYIHIIYEQPEENLTEKINKLKEKGEILPTDEKWKIFISMALAI